MLEDTQRYLLRNNALIALEQAKTRLLQLQMAAEAGWTQTFATIQHEMEAGDFQCVCSRFTFSATKYLIGL